jgi:hypothetical protein
MKKSFTIAQNKDGTCSSKCHFYDLWACSIGCDRDDSCRGPGVYRMRLDRIKGKEKNAR